MALSVQDRLDLHEAYARYAAAMDAWDIPAWVGFYLDDGVFDAPGGALEGREQMLAVFSGMAEKLGQRAFDKTQHRMSNIILSGDGDDAQGLCYIDFIGEDKETGQYRIVSSGTYRDQWRREGGRWLLVRRTLRWGPPDPSMVPAP